MPVESETSRESPSVWLGYIRIARIDHWVKNVFVLLGILVALSIDPGRYQAIHVINFALGLLAICLVTSSNYV